MKKKGLGIFTGFIILALLACAILSWYIFGPVIRTDDGEEVTFYIPKEATFQTVLDTLQQHSLIRHPRIFSLIAWKKSYPGHIKSGHYRIRNRTSYNRLINMLRGGLQAPVLVTFTHEKSLAQLAGTLAGQLAFDSVSFISLIRDQEKCNELGFDTQTIAAVFIPNTYELYWNISPEKFMERMRAEYDRFWSPERKKAAEQLGLTPIEVITLASIVEEETWHPEEMPLIAGVYLNRLKKGMRLQADPTIKFAVGDVNKRRILTRDLQVDSPYNTYRHSGLPPGPITIPSIRAIDAVLHADDHSYLYFCAKEDFSGYHYFSKTLRQHNLYAARYRKALNRNRVYH